MSTHESTVPIDRASKVWRVYRWEHPDGRYFELATNALAPDEIALPPAAKGYTFASSTPMVPEADVERLRDALREIASRPTVERNPDGDDQAAHTMQMIARDALGEA